MPNNERLAPRNVQFLLGRGAENGWVVGDYANAKRRRLGTWISYTVFRASVGGEFGARYYYRK